MESLIRSKKACIKLISKTWDKDTNGLFDYYSKETSDYKSVLYGDVNIVRQGKEVKQGTTKEENEENTEQLFNIKRQGDNFIIENNIETDMEQNEQNITELNNKIFYVIHNRNKKMFLLNDDVFKLGRIKYVISEVSIYSGDTKYDLTIPNLPMVSNINKQNSKIRNPFNLVRVVKSLSDIGNISEEKILCKICYMEETDPENNPMVHLCKCKGSLNYTHFYCIKYWMKTKLQIKENEKKTVKNYFISKFNCEICKTPFPFKFKLNRNNNKIYELIDIERPNCNYLMLESLDQIKENNENHKFIHVIKLINEEDITIGRSNFADIKIHDISVSRIHAKLNFNFAQKSLEITDLKSKFGTLVLIKDKIELKCGESLIAQIGRTLFGVNVVKKEEEKINEINVNEEIDKINPNEKEPKTNKENNKEINSNKNLENKYQNEENQINNQNDNSNDNDMEIS